MNSKWSYVLCGFYISSALLCAVAGGLFTAIFSSVCVALNWYAAEARRKFEDQVLILKSNEKENGKKETDNDEEV